MQTTKLHAAVTLLIPIALTAFGCGQQTPEGGEPSGSSTTAAAVSGGDSAAEELVVLCGHSFRNPVERLLEQFELEAGLKTTVSFEGSENLLPQVKLKAPGDIFVTHDPYMQLTTELGAVLDDWVPVGHVAPVLVVKKGNPKALERFEDLTKPDLEVILPDPNFSTCGEMVFALMDKKEIKDAVLRNVKAQFKSHSEIGNQMKLGYGDAAMMWNGVAKQFEDAVDVVPCPYEYDEEIRVGVIGLAHTSKVDHVRRFLEFVKANGEAIFEEFGYVK
jgi:ABC-type molybdate transport system substrate-binding protein